MFDPAEHPHRRLNTLTGEYVLVSPHRAKRPWQGQVEKSTTKNRPSYDPKCYLCVRNQRISGERNEKYEHTYVFTNDFSALIPQTQGVHHSDALLHLEGARGITRAVCFLPRHDLIFLEMSVAEIEYVVDTLAGQVSDLGQEYEWVQVFENKGAVMISSMPHLHGQNWAIDALPNEHQQEHTFKITNHLCWLITCNLNWRSKKELN